MRFKLDSFPIFLIVRFGISVLFRYFGLISVSLVTRHGRIEKWLPPKLEITSKMHKLQAKIIPDCLFKCIFSIILKLSLHFKIISMPVYSEPQVKAPDHNAFAVNCNKFSAPGWRKNLFFLRQNMKICTNGAAWLEH